MRVKTKFTVEKIFATPAVVITKTYRQIKIGILFLCFMLEIDIAKSLNDFVI